MTARRHGAEDEKAIFSELFGSAGWRSGELIKEMRDSSDFYCKHMGVVRLDTWSNGRVGLLGDAAHCPTATPGMGTISSLVGAYVLAGEIQRHCRRDARAKEIVPEALHTYEERFRPFMKTVQDGIEKDKTYWYKMPSGPILLMALNLFLAIASFFRLDVLAKNTMREDTGDWKLPDYEGMDLRKKKD
nr:hypothetical protein FVER53263_13475 [Fusarium verticillioides]